MIRVDPRIALDGLFAQLPAQAATEYSEDDELREVSMVSLRVHALVEELCKHYFGTVLGQIVHPRYSKGVIIDRIIAANQILVGMLRKRLRRARAMLKSSPPEKAAEVFAEMLSDIDFTFIAMREVVNRFMTLLHLNLPAAYRPPLANVRIGYDIVV